MRVFNFAVFIIKKMIKHRHPDRSEAIHLKYLILNIKGGLLRLANART